MMEYIEIVAFTSEWKLNELHRQHILEYCQDIFDIEAKDFIFMLDEDGDHHLMVNKNHKNLEKVSQEKLHLKTNWVEGFVWGISYAQFKKRRPSKKPESQNASAKEQRIS